MSARLSLSLACCLLLLRNGLAGEAKPVKGTVKTDDGLNIVYEVRGKGDTALVFLHGWCGDRAWWKNQVDVFAADYRVVAVDQAGHGEAGKERKEWTVDSLAADAQALVKALELKRVILVGHSMGGPVALAAAKRLPGTVVAVVGVDTLHNAEFKWPEEDSKKAMAAMEADFKGTLRLMLRMMLPEKVDAESLEWMTSRAERQDPKMAVALMHSLARADVKTLLKEAKVPVRCINAAPGGTKFAIPTDRAVNKKYADFDAVLMEGVGHFPMVERPDEFNRKLRDVLKEFATK